MTQKVALAQPKFIKVKEIESARTGYNVYVKVISADKKIIQTKDGEKIPMVDCVVADQTGSAKAFFKGDNANLIQKGAVLAIRNGVKRYVKDFINLQVDLFGRLTVQKGVNITPSQAYNISTIEHKLERKPRNNNRPNNRNDNRRPRENRDNRQPRRDNRDNRQPRRDNRDNRQPRRDNRDNRDNRRQQRVDRNDRPERNSRPQRNNVTREERPNNRYNDRNNGGQRSYNRPERRNNNRTYDRDFDRQQRTNNVKPRQYQQKRQQNRERRAPISWIKIADIGPAQDKLNIIVKVLSVKPVGNKLRCVIGDSTGVSNAFINEHPDVQQNQSIVLFNAVANVVKEHIQIQLTRYGRIEKSRKPVDKINETFNLSDKAWVPIQ